MCQWAPLLCWLVLAASDSPAPEWDRPGRSGTNCLYVYLKMSGHPPSSYGDVATAVPVDEKRGATLADLATAAGRFGADMAPRRIQDSELGTIPLPFIAQLDQPDVGEAAHFITVYRIETDGTVRYIDGSSGLKTMRSLKQLRPLLAADALVASTGTPRSRSAIPIVLCGLLLGLLLGALALKRPVG